MLKTIVFLQEELISPRLISGTSEQDSMSVDTGFIHTTPKSMTFKKSNNIIFKFSIFLFYWNY